MAAPAAVLSILVRANTGAATTGLIRINQQLDRTEAKSHKVARAIEGVAKGFALVGAGGAIAGIAYATKKAADFEQQMSSLGSVTDATAKQMERFRKQALKAGADTKFSALEAAQAQTELAKGGLKTAQILKGGLSAALALAAAGELDLADAASTTANAMNLFGLRGKQSMKVADMLAKAANATTADVSDFAMALSQGGSVAKSAGLSFRETVLALEALAKSGIKNSDAGTSLKTAMIQLIKPTAKQKELADKLNISFLDQAGNFKNLADVSTMLRARLGDMTKAQRTAVLATLAGTDGVRTLTALYDAGAPRLKAWSKGLAEQGTAAEVAKKKQDNLKGSLEQLRGSFETLAIQVGTTMLPAIRKVADELTGLTNDIGRIMSRKDLTLGEKLQKSLDLAKVRIDPWVEKLKVAIDHANIPDKLAAIISAATPLIVKAAAQAGLATAKTFAGAFAQSDVWGKLVLGGWLLSRMGGKAGFFKMGAVAGTSFGEGMAATSATGFAGRFRGLIGGAKGLIKKAIALDVGINLIDSKGNLIAAAINTAHDLTFGIVPKVKSLSGNERAEASIKGVADQLDRALKGGHIGALEKIRDKIKGMADEARDFGRADLAGQLDHLADKGTHSLNRLSDSQHKVAGMSDRFAAAIRGLRVKGSKDFGGLVDQVTFGSKQILNVGGAKSEQTQKAISKQFRIARNRVQQAMNDQVISVKKGMGLLHDLAVKELGLYGIKAGRVNVVLARGANGQMRPNARGGFQTGGKPVGDSIPSLLERGEYVVNRKAVQKVGKRNLDRLNFGAAPRFQAGGMVDPAWDPGTQRLNASISGRVGAWAKRYNADMTAGYDPGGGHVSPGHNITGTATDMVPLSGNWDLLEKGLRTLVAAGLKVLYGSNGVGIPWPNHGRGNHAHIEWGFGGGGAGLVPDLARVMLKGPSSVALEAGQGALDRVRGAANSSISRALAFSTESGETGSNFAGGEFGKAALKNLWVKAGGSPKVANLMAAIALAESGGNSKAHNPSGASGLWQILGLPFPGNVFDPLTNARMAVSKYSSQGLGAWEAYTNGNYAQYLQRGGLVGMQKGGGITSGLLKAFSHGHGKHKHRPLQKATVNRLLKRIRGLGLPDGLQSKLKGASGDVNVFGDYADRAMALSGDDANGNPVIGSIKGHDEAYWVTQQLEAMLKWRNALIRAHEWLVNKRGEVSTAWALAGMSQKSMRKRVAALQRHPKKNRKLLKALRPQLKALDRLVPALWNQRRDLGTTNSDVVDSLRTLQGVGSPMRFMKTLPTLGVLGGDILQGQIRRRDLNAPASPVTDSDDSSSSERSDLLSQLLREANLRTAVSQAQYKVFQGMPQFATGGIVPGSAGQAVPAVVHAGEGVFTRDQMAAMGAGSVVVLVQDGAVDPNKIRVIAGQEAERISRTQSRNANRGLPGRGGGGLRG